jgi:hypothetical protein
VAKSLFTHMLADELSVYLRQVRQRLVENGRGLLAFFLLNRHQRDLHRRGMSTLTFIESGGKGPVAYRRPSAPTAAVAYDEDFVLNRLAEAGLTCASVHYGSWSGRSNALTFQDLMVVERSGARLVGGASGSDGLALPKW